MPALKSIEEKYINNLKVDKENDTCWFNDATHKYYDKEDGLEYASVTTIIHSFSQPFDSNFFSLLKGVEKIADAMNFMSMKPKFLEKHTIPDNAYEQLGITKEQALKEQQKILQEWKDKTEEACDWGTKIHAMMENSFYTSGNKQDLEKFGIGGKLGAYEGYYKLDKPGIYPEFFLSLKSRDGLLRVAGQADCICVNDNKVYVIDFKTNREIKKRSYFNSKTKKSQMMKYPLNNLQDANFYHYNLQLSTYWMMIKTMYPEYELGGLIIYHIARDGKETKYEVPYLEDEVKRMLNYYKKQIKLRQEYDRNKSSIWK